MLHAVNRRKARIDLFRGPGRRLPLEDVVTSTIFGPLLFLDQAEATAAVATILKCLAIDKPGWLGPSHLALWPRRPTIEALRSSYVEPDAEIVDASGNSLTIEVKWGAPLSEHELASQWLSLSAEARIVSRHLVIVLEPERYRSDIDHDRRTIARHCPLPWNVNLVSWRRLSDCFREISSDIALNAGTRRWAAAVHGFLRREDPLSLAGWDGLDLEPVAVTSWHFDEAHFSHFPQLRAVNWHFTEGWFGASSPIASATWSFRR